MTVGSQSPRTACVEIQMTDKVQAYLTRRVKQLISEGWEHNRIVQQLEAVAWLHAAAHPKTYIQNLIEEVSQ